MSERTRKKVDAAVVDKSDAVMKAIFWQFGKHNLSMEGSILVLAASYAMVLNQAKSAEDKKRLSDLFDGMVAKSRPSNIIVPGN